MARKSAQRNIRYPDDVVDEVTALADAKILPEANFSAAVVMLLRYCVKTGITKRADELVLSMLGAEPRPKK